MKKVLITGSSSGFGYLITLRFARNGYKVFATTRDLGSEGVGEINEIAQKENLNIQWLVLDITKDDEIKEAFNIVEKEGLDLLINNAGFGILGPIQSYKFEDVRKQHDTNFLGTVRMIYSFLPLLLKSEDGRIINMSSMAGLVVAPAYGLYSSSKFALEAFTETLRYELSQTNVKVCLIEPGGFDTNFSKNAKGLSVERNHDESYEKWYLKIKNLRNKFLGEGDSKNRLRDPQKVADFVYKISQKKNPRLRNVIGSGAYFTMLLRKLLPVGWWENGMALILKIGMRMK